MSRLLLAAALALPVTPLAAQAPAAVKKAEAAVRAYVAENVGDPDSVKWVKWGPHDLKGKANLTTDFLLSPAGLFRLRPDVALAHLNADYPTVYDRLKKLDFPGALPVVRVRYRLAGKTGGKELHDMLFAVVGKTVLPLGKNGYGDGWIAGLKPAPPQK